MGRALSLGAAAVEPLVPLGARACSVRLDDEVCVERSVFRELALLEELLVEENQDAPLGVT